MQAKHETQLDERPIRAFISAREAGKFAAAADDSGNSRSRKGGRGAWALQVFNLAWETTEDDLVEHFKDCPVSEQNRTEVLQGVSKQLRYNRTPGE
jgi:hypothetical protein